MIILVIYRNKNAIFDFLCNCSIMPINVNAGPELHNVTDIADISV